MRSARLAAGSWRPFAAVALFLAVWQLAVVVSGVEAWILPGPVRIVEQALANFPRIWMHTAATLKLTLSGLAVGASVGIAVAAVLHLIPGLKPYLYPLLIFTQNIPTLALAPLLLIWFGYGLVPKIILLTLVCFFPVAVAAMDGLLNADPVMMNYMRMIGATKRQIFVKLEIPNALPQLFSGLKIAATYSVMGAIVAEWLGSDKGIGTYMLLARSAFRTDWVFVGIFVVVLLSMLLFGAIAILQRAVIRWKPDDRS